MEKALLLKAAPRKAAGVLTDDQQLKKGRCRERVIDTAKPQRRQVLRIRNQTFVDILVMSVAV